MRLTVNSLCCIKWFGNTRRRRTANGAITTADALRASRGETPVRSWPLARIYKVSTQVLLEYATLSPIWSHINEFRLLPHARWSNEKETICFLKKADTFTLLFIESKRYVPLKQTVTIAFVTDDVSIKLNEFEFNTTNLLM